MNIIDVIFYIIMLALPTVYVVEWYNKNWKINKDTVDGDRLMETYTNLKMRGKIK
jgi:hypothetical protein